MAVRSLMEKARCFAWSAADGHNGPMAVGTTRRASVRDGFRLAWPLAVAVGVFGISFGVLAPDAGLGPVAAVTMSATTFAGSAQFAAISVLAAGGGALSASLAAILLNARYGAIGFSVAPAFTGRAVARFLKAQLIVDESWAVASQGDGRFEPRVLVGAGLALYVAWVGGTVAGVAGGRLVADPQVFGLDAAFPALFLALLSPMVRERRPLAAALAGAAIALVLTPLVRPGLPIIAAVAACALGWWRR